MKYFYKGYCLIVYESGDAMLNGPNANRLLFMPKQISNLSKEERKRLVFDSWFLSFYSTLTLLEAKKLIKSDPGLKYFLKLHKPY